jgi:hypothetical protein
MTIITIVCTIITVGSAALGIYQFCKSKRIEQLRIDDALLLHKISGQALGAIQGNNDSNKMLEKFPETENTKKIIYDIGLSEGYCQSLFIATAKIFCNLRRMTIQDINNMIENKQLNGYYKDLYLSFVENKKDKS